MTSSNKAQECFKKLIQDQNNSASILSRAWSINLITCEWLGEFWLGQCNQLFGWSLVECMCGMSVWPTNFFLSCYIGWFSPVTFQICSTTHCKGPISIFPFNKLWNIQYISFEFCSGSNVWLLYQPYNFKETTGPEYLSNSLHKQVQPCWVMLPQGQLPWSTKRTGISYLAPQQQMHLGKNYCLTPLHKLCVGLGVWCLWTTTKDAQQKCSTRRTGPLTHKEWNQLPCPSTMNMPW